MKIQILEWSKWCRNQKVGTAVPFQPGRYPPGFYPVDVANLPRQRKLAFRPGLEPNQTKPTAEILTSGGLPGPVAYTSHSIYFSNWGFHHSLKISLMHLRQYAQCLIALAISSSLGSPTANHLWFQLIRAIALHTNKILLHPVPGEWLSGCVMFGLLLNHTWSSYTDPAA